MAVTRLDLFAFGSRAKPRLPRIGPDVMVDSAGLVVPQSPPFPYGPSLFADPLRAPLHGHYHKLPKGTLLPHGLEIVADGNDVDPRSPHDPTHHTLYASVTMPLAQLVDSWANLPWEYGGNKK